MGVFSRDVASANGAFLCRMEAIRRFMDWAGPIVYLAMLGLMVLIVGRAGWENISFTLSETEMSVSQTAWTMLLGAALVVSYFAGPTLNFGDFSRYAKTISDMKKGNFWGLPVNFLFFSLISVVTISGTRAVFGELIVDPIAVMGRLDNKAAVLLLGLTMLVATVGVNIVANFVSAAFDISNIFPKYISWRKGGMLASIVSVLILPWNLFSSPEVIHLTVDLLAALIGPVYGILIVDYYLVKRGKISVADLYSTSSTSLYWYRHGVNWQAVGALLPAGAASILVMLLDNGTGWANFTFFIGGILAAAIYLCIARR